MLWAIPQMVKVIASWSTGLWHQAWWWASEKGSFAHPFKAELGVGTSLQEMFTSLELPERRRSVFHYYWIILYPSFQMPLETFTINAFHCCWVTKSCPNLCNSMDCSTPGSHVFHYLLSLLKLEFIESIMPSNRLILCRPFLLLPSIFPSIRVFANESALHIRRPKY